MSARRPISVVIVSQHPLLGEGLAQMLRAEPDLAVTSVPFGAEIGAEIASRAPDVAIVERGLRPPASTLQDLAPRTLFIEFGMDAGPLISYCREEIPAQPGRMLRAIRHVRRLHGAGASVGTAVLLGLVALQPLLTPG